MKDIIATVSWQTILAQFRRSKRSISSCMIYDSSLSVYNMASNFGDGKDKCVQLVFLTDSP